MLCKEYCSFCWSHREMERTDKKMFWVVFPVLCCKDVTLINHSAGRRKSPCLITGDVGFPRSGRLREATQVLFQVPWGSPFCPQEAAGRGECTPEAAPDGVDFHLVPLQLGYLHISLCQVVLQLSDVGLSIHLLSKNGPSGGWAGPGQAHAASQLGCPLAAS